MAFILVVAMAGAGPASAQTAQPGTPLPAPAVPGENSPRAEGPGQMDPDAHEEDEEDGGEGCPYLGTPLELTV